MKRKKQAAAKKDLPAADSSIRNKVTQFSQLPRDVVMGMPMLTMIGQMELCIENYRGIIEYTESLLRIQTKHGQIRICGEHLRVNSYTNDEMKITGCITIIEYLNMR